MSLRPDLDAIRSTNPPTWPQYPFNEPPKAFERSTPTYSIVAETDHLIPMRDGVRLAADVYRPSAPGRRFPGLLATSPYGRQLQKTHQTDGQNEAGITEFWVPHGYAQIIVDVRGTNDSEGSWEHMGPTEQRDLFDLVEWVAKQPWCDGNVGMTGESYFGWSQTMAATQQPPHLKAVFPHAASNDLYRDRFYNGGIFRNATANWLYVVREINGRARDPSGILKHSRSIMEQEFPLDGPYWQERLSWKRLDRIKIPVYFSSAWPDVGRHLRGATEGWGGVGSIPKKMFIGPRAKPGKPTASYHGEALRWYDHHLKGMNNHVMEGPPIQIFVQGTNRWRGEQEWPLARTQWREFFLAGDGSSSPRKLADSAGRDGEVTYNYDPSTYEAYMGGPKLVYRSEPLGQDMEVTGPLVLHLWASSTATDTDWYVAFDDESPDGQVRKLTLGWLKASHRELDPSRSKPWRPFHPHLKADPLVPGKAHEFAIEVWPTSNLFQAGHRLRLEVASCDDQSNISSHHQLFIKPAKNTVLEGRKYPSRLIVPVVPS
jgi:predicted acyl esterase